MRPHLLTFTLALVSLSVHAQENESYCALATAQGRVQSALLLSPEAFASVGDPTAENRSAVAGVRGSLARMRQGRLANELAAAQCAAYQSKKRLGLRLASIELQVERRGLTAQHAALRGALVAAESHVGQERKMLERQQATLLDVRAAFDMRDRLKEKQVRAEQRLSFLAAHAPQENAALLPDVERAIADQARVNELGAKMQAESGWDVNMAVGVRRGLSDGTQSTFASVALTRNFGAGASQQAARDTNALTARWLAAQEDGPLQQLQRARDAVAGAHAAGKTLHTGLLERRQTLRDTLGTVEGSDTAAAARIARNLRIEILLVDAELADSSARQSYLQEWRTLNEPQP
ncbi:MAG TPA: hypothetical protein VGE70_02710 [Burkholderiaceae bacterium]